MGCVNADDERAPFMSSGAKCPMLTYSAAGGMPNQAENVRLTGEGVHFEAVYGAERVQTELAPWDVLGMTTPSASSRRAEPRDKPSKGAPMRSPAPRASRDAWSACRPTGITR